MDKLRPVHAVPEPIAIEARAKLFWGESPAKVQAFLLGKNVGEKDAGELVKTLVAERAATIRSDGIRKICWGASFIAAPITYYLVTHLWVGYWNLKAFAGLLVLGAIGIAKLTQGVGMTLRPKAITGDLSNAAD